MKKEWAFWKLIWLSFKDAEDLEDSIFYRYLRILGVRAGAKGKEGIQFAENWIHKLQEVESDREWAIEKVHIIVFLISPFFTTYLKPLLVS